MQLKRSDINIKADAKKVIAKYLDFGEPSLTNRIGRLVKDILKLDEKEVEKMLSGVYEEFGNRHLNFDFLLDEHYQKVIKAIPQDAKLSEKQKKLIGAYFTMEYSIRSAALFNPSIVPHPDQSGAKPGEKRFIMSLRAVGEGHISSIEFRSGTINAAGQITLEEESGLASVALPDHSKAFSKEKLRHRTRILPDFDIQVFDPLGDLFTKNDYLKLPEEAWSGSDSDSLKVLDDIMDSNYDVIRQKGSKLSDTVVFPRAQQESRGMEDVRFVEFKEQGASTFIGTYTAYNGHRISPQLIITKDFSRFKIRTMYGEAVNDKGFALFPEKINGRFVMLGRQGGENITIMYSDDLFCWETYENIMVPESTWGLTQLGNCGSPVKTSEGWLVLTHGVGPVRKYVISAILLDINEPSKIIKKLQQPLISPNAEEREGYVPNVVYSCGAMVHGEQLVIPYAMSDSATTFGFVNIQDLLSSMEKC